MEISQYLDLIEDKLNSNFDIERNYKLNNFTYGLFAEYHLRNEKYMLVKQAVVYAFENNEYCLIKYYNELSANNYKIFIDSLTNSIESIVNPSREHMSSIITGVIVTEKIHEQEIDHIRKKIKQFKYDKGFAFGFKGWADIRIILVSLNEGLITYNKKGREVSSVYNF